MPGLSYERHCAEIVAQTNRLNATIAGAELSALVPSCPEWNLGQLLGHIGAMHRWAAEIVRTRAPWPPADEQVHAISVEAGADVGGFKRWLTQGAAHVAETLRAAGAGAWMWTPIPTQTAAFWARRIAYDTLVHRADAAQAVGVEFIADVDVVRDALDEWMEAGALPQVIEAKPHMRGLLGLGHTVRLHATDIADEARASWVVDLTGEQIRWRRTSEHASVTLGGPLVSLLLAVYGRCAPGEGIELVGDAELWHSWLDGVSFWLHE